MKATVKGSLLTNTLRRAQLSASPVNPIHALVKIEARAKEGDEAARLTFTSTAGTIALNTSIAADVKAPGVIAAHTRELFAAASAMPEGDIVLSLDGSRVRIRGSSGRTWSSGTADPTTIQPTPEPTDAEWLKVPVALLRTGIERIGYTTSDVEKFEGERAGLRIEATKDRLYTIGFGHNMVAALEQESKDIGIKAERWIGLLPTGALTAIGDVLAEATEMKADAIELYVDRTMLYVIGPATLLVAALPHGEYPPWQHVFKEFPKEPVCTVPRLALMESIKACLATSSKLDPGAMVRIHDMKLELYREDPGSDFRDEVPLLNMAGKTDLKMKCGLPFLHSLLKGASEDADFYFDTNCRLILVKSPGYQAAVPLMVIPPCGAPT